MTLNSAPSVALCFKPAVWTNQQRVVATLLKVGTNCTVINHTVIIILKTKNNDDN